MTDRHATTELLGEHVAGALDPGAARELERHVGRCPSCALELAALERLDDGLRCLARPAPRPSLLGEIAFFLREEKLFWVAPLVIALVALSAVVLFAEGSAIAPFIYSIF
jgi:anti-sigma factor RsiW